jgi:hypothetical protein
MSYLARSYLARKKEVEVVPLVLTRFAAENSRRYTRISL